MEVLINIIDLIDRSLALVGDYFSTDFEVTLLSFFITFELASELAQNLIAMMTYWYYSVVGIKDDGKPIYIAEVAEVSLARKCLYGFIHVGKRTGKLRQGKVAFWYCKTYLLYVR